MVKKKLLESRKTQINLRRQQIETQTVEGSSNQSPYGLQLGCTMGAEAASRTEESENKKEKNRDREEREGINMWGKFLPGDLPNKQAAATVLHAQLIHVIFVVYLSGPLYRNLL